MKRGFLVFLSCLVAVLGVCVGQAMAVNVYGEGAYTDTQLDVYIYADMDVDAVLSFGVKLTYDPAVLAVSSAEKDVNPIPYTTNPAKWYLGENDAAYRNNPDPDTSTAGEVMIIGGKLDPGSPTAGVAIGDRVFLGKVTFVPASGGTFAGNPGDAITGLTYARGAGADTYKNFVRFDSVAQAGEVLDGGITFGHPDFGGVVVVKRRGDANADGTVNVQDMSAVRYYMQNGGDENPWKDCNADGAINVQDMSCVRYIMTH